MDRRSSRFEQWGLLEKYRALCRKYRALVDCYGAEISSNQAQALSLSFAAIRRSRTGMALLRNGEFLIRNVRWLALERRGGPWRRGGDSYPHLHALALREAAAMAHGEERVREERFARGEGDGRVIEIRLEQLERSGAALYLAMARDVTESVLAEEREERARSDAAERERLRSVGDLASATAHEINNVLHAMAMRVASLRGEPRSGAREEGLTALARMVSEAAACVSRLEDDTGRSRAVAAVTPVPLATDPPHPRAPRPEARLHVLVVDDDPDVLEAAGLVLEHLDQSVELAASGVEAIARLRTGGERFDLVLCDLGMPEVDGWQVADEVRQLTPNTPLYLVSAWGREISPERAALAGVAGLLSKPLSLEVLRDVLAASLPRERRERALPETDAPAEPRGSWAH
jgi:CheY-like chemotaxis protein